ncbi:serine/arginine-rich splicing factor 7-like [Babylonia areolata]|uniref:serine/arginine-rich splicing factor 7-like n=1 Tax=Babylonia areolata TaxID=304850 RepID=UPI003FD13441
MRSRSRSPTSTTTTPSLSPSRSPSPSPSLSRSPSPPARRRVERVSSEGQWREGGGEGRRVHVGSLAAGTSPRELQRRFRQFGEVVEVWVARTQPCFAFVVFRHKEDAWRAVQAMDGQTLNSRRMRVTVARPRTKGTRSGGAFNPYLRCYQCGKMGHFSRVCRAHQWSHAPSASRHRGTEKAREDTRYNAHSQHALPRSSSGDVTYRRF